METIQHPAVAEERTHLTATLATIGKEHQVAMAGLRDAEGELSEARTFSPDELPLREMLFASARQTVRNMELAKAKPYFTRINFTETGGDAQRYYIGKYGVLRSDTLDVVVVDWRAPVANLYYSGQIGPMHYTAPDGTIEGELTLKRQFTIEDGELVSIFDTDIVSQDAYLQSALEKATGDRLREIVTTIQAEQNFVIRYPLNRSLIVQGVAGSGKTTIALHRIAYLLYAFQDQLRPEHMMILAPNPLFLNFIAGILPDLGVERVQQTTFTRMLYDRFSKSIPKCDKADRIETILNLDEDALRRRTAIAQAKGSLELGRMIEDFMDAYEDDFPPAEGIRYGNLQLFSGRWLRHFLLVDEKPFTMQRRLQEFKKQLKGAVKGATRLIIARLTEAYDRNLYALSQKYPDFALRKPHVEALRAKFDADVDAVQKRGTPYMKEVLASFPSLDPAVLYRAFWADVLETAPEDSDFHRAAAYTLERIDAKRNLEPEDLAPIALIALRLVDIPRIDIRHIVVDEAQDFSPIEFLLLQKLAPRATMTVVGDLMQGVNGWRGLSDWGVLEHEIFHDEAAMHYLVTSYRNTVEIMNAAIEVANRRPVPGQVVAKPVLRHGEPPTFISVATDSEQAKIIADLVRKWRGEGLSTIAIIDRSSKKLSKLRDRLPDDLSATLLDVNADAYDGGVVLAPASAVKGLEFDGVIISDISSECFRDTDLDTRLLYVCMTRALHKMACLTR